jgi:uncharacterized damage-inducible protein DinB
MNTIEFIHQMIEAAHGQTDDSMKDTTAEQFNWTPPGTANPISAVFVHLLNSEDFFIQSIIQEKQRLWEKGDWGKKTGVKNTPGYGGNWDEFKHASLALDPVMAYQQVVRAATEAYLEQLTPEELERKVKFAGGERSVSSMLILLTSHTLCHAGEIAALKGVQGTKGLPY